MEGVLKLGKQDFKIIIYLLYEAVFSVHERVFLLVILTKCTIKTKNNFVFSSFTKQLFAPNM